MGNIKDIDNIIKNVVIEKEKEIEDINSKLRSIRALKMAWYSLIAVLTALSIALFIFFNNFENGNFKALFDLINENVFYVVIGFATIVTACSEARTNYLENKLSWKLKK